MVHHINVARIRKDIFKEWQQSVYFDIASILETIIESVFLRSGRFLMEFIQNAEDACMERFGENKRQGRIYIELHEDKLIFRHNGKPFDEEDVKAISALRSRKDPSKGYLGYMGIGFKSVFKVAKRVVICSRYKNLSDKDNIFCFEFNENPPKSANLKYWDKKLWMCLPLELDPSTLEVTFDPEYTTQFIIYFRSKEIFDMIRESLEKLKHPVFIFLRHISYVEKIIHYNGNVYEESIEIVTKTEEQDENIVREKVYATVIQNGEESRIYYIVFRKIFDVPPAIKNHEKTKKVKRNNVSQREVIIAFRYNNATKMLELMKFSDVISGVYSFLPLEETKSGLRFLIQADFVAQAGRETMPIEHPWNSWMMKCVADLVSYAIEYFQTESSSKKFRNYLEVFQYDDVESEIYQKLIKTIVVENVIKRKLYDPYVIAIDGSKVRLSKAVIRTKEIEPLIIEQRILGEEDLKVIFKEEGLKFVSPDLEDYLLDEHKEKIKRLTLDLLFNQNLISKKGKKFLIALYDQLAKIKKKSEVMYNSIKQRLKEEEKCYVILEDGALGNLASDEIYSKGGLEDILSFANNVSKIVKSKDIFVGLKFIDNEFESDNNRFEILKDLGLKILDKAYVFKEYIRPIISVDENPERKLNQKKEANTLDSKSLKALTAMMIYLLANENIRLSDVPKNIWVITYNGEIKPSDKLFYFDNYFDELKKYFGHLIPNFDEYRKACNIIGNFDKETIDEILDNLFRNCCKYIYYYSSYYPRGYVYWNEFTNNLNNLLKEKAEKRRIKELIELTYIMKKLWSEYEYDLQFPFETIPVITIDGGIMMSSDCFFSSQYDPTEIWDRWIHIVDDIVFISERYLNYEVRRKDIDDEDIKDEWKKFFKKFGVKEEASREYIGKFAEKFVKRDLQEQKFSISPGSEGYDFCAKKDKYEFFVEVKGRRKEDSIELYGNELESAKKYKEKYVLAVVYNIPNDPKIYYVRNPFELHHTDKIELKSEQIKKYGQRKLA